MNFSIDELNTIPWNQKYLREGEFPPEPKVSEMNHIAKIPFIKRDKQYSLFYTWYEIYQMANSHGIKKTILDSACGRGQISQMLFLSGHNVFSCDIDNCFGGDVSINFKIANLNEAFPYEDNSFETVINSTALHYLRSSENYFTECKRVLKNNGELVFSIPNISNYAERINFLRKGIFSEYGEGYLQRKNFLYPPYIFTLLKYLNFKIIEIRGVVAIINTKIKIFNMIAPFFSSIKNDDIFKYSNVLVIKAKLSK